MINNHAHTKPPKLPGRLTAVWPTISVTSILIITAIRCPIVWCQYVLGGMAVLFVYQMGMETQMFGDWLLETWIREAKFIETVRNRTDSIRFGKKDDEQR